MTIKLDKLTPLFCTKDLSHEQRAAQIRALYQEAKRLVDNLVASQASRRPNHAFDSGLSGEFAEVSPSFSEQGYAYARPAFALGANLHARDPQPFRLTRQQRLTRTEPPLDPTGKEAPVPLLAPTARTVHADALRVRAAK